MEQTMNCNFYSHFNANLLVMKIRIKKAKVVLRHQQLHQQYLYSPPTTMKQFEVLNMTIDRLQLLHYIPLIRARTMTVNLKRKN